jgi:prepilin-type N-terminal cleavage/methylation domain-containing protein
MTNGKSLKIYRGFTLIELLITFAVIGILAAVSTVSFITYNQSQSLTNAARDIEQMLTLAKSRAQSQVKPADCAGSLTGYVFRTCSQSQPCLSNGDYEVVVACNSLNGESAFIPSSPAAGASPKKLPAGIMFSESSKGKSFEFGVLTGGVTNTSDLILEGPGNLRKIITIDEQGNINEK